MSSKVASLEEQARDLPPAERARLALTLIESLDPGFDESAEDLWLDEAERRLGEYDAGTTVARPAHDVISEIRHKLK
ncbi:MAG: addiction module antitoxin RelB [Gammaproteobacteria bacterium PRO9]|nr:addiction module antitoxin RelB [Gammaproteobacteria bacterium PRO9]